VNIQGHSEIDKIGISLSGLCAIHCLVTPLLLLFIPAWGSYFQHEFVHIIFFLIVSPLALVSFYRVLKKHRNRVPLILGIIGSGVLLLSFFEAGHNHSGVHFLSVVGSIFLISGHYISLKKCRCGHTAH